MFFDNNMNLQTLHKLRPSMSMQSCDFNQPVHVDV